MYSIVHLLVWVVLYMAQLFFYIFLYIFHIFLTASIHDIQTANLMLELNALDKTI